MTLQRAILHRDGTVTYFSVFSGQWQYHVDPTDISPAHMNTFKPEIREHIMKRREVDRPRTVKRRATNRRRPKDNTA